MGLLRLLLFGVGILFLASCKVEGEGQFSFPSSELPSLAPGDAPPFSSSSFSLTNSILLAYSSSGFGSGLGANNVVYDGTYLVVPALTASGTIAFGLLNGSSMVSVTSYNAIAPNAHQLYAATSNGAGNVYVLYRNSGGTRYISSWPSVNPSSPLTTIVFNPSTYGCDTGVADYKIALSGSTFYGACTSASAPAGQLRLFSFNSSGTLLSAITVSWLGSASGPVEGLTILDGNLILGADAGVAPWGSAFYKYNLSFQYLGKSSDSTGSLGNVYDDVSSIATDGNSLIIGNGYEFCSGYSACYRFSKITKGDL